jgi:long-chain fatty acid transport protein
MKGTAGAYLAGFPAQNARYDLTLPSTLSVGIEHRLSPDLRLFAEGRRSGWKRFTGFDIAYTSGQPNDLRPVDWQDTWMAAVGLGIKLLPSTELTAGLSTETAASKQGSGTTVSPDAATIMAGVGVIHDALRIGRFSVSYAHVFLQDAPVSANNLASGALAGTLKGRLGYTYTW